MGARAGHSGLREGSFRQRPRLQATGFQEGPDSVDPPWNFFRLILQLRFFFLGMDHVLMTRITSVLLLVFSLLAFFLSVVITVIL